MTDPGVVDPIRIPAWIRIPAQRWWRDLPTVARVFLVLALVDLLARSIGVVEPRIDFGFEFPLGFIGAVLPHDLWILLPALIVARRPDAPTATPAIFRGAIVLALVELLASPINHLLAGMVGGGALDVIAISSLPSIGTNGLRVVGWILLGRGLAALNPRQPSQPVAGLSNLVAIAVAGEVVVGLFQMAVSPPYDFGDPGLAMFLALSSMVSIFSLAGWGYLLWILVRGFGDTRRPESATITAAVGAALSGMFGLLAGILGSIAVATQRPFEAFLGRGGQDLMNVFSWLELVIAPSLILAAFALGLAEPPIPLAAPSSGGGPSTDPGRVKAPSGT